MFCTSVIVPRSCVCQRVFKHVGAHHAFVGVNACLAARAMRVKVCLCVCVCSRMLVCMSVRKQSFNGWKHSQRKELLIICGFRKDFLSSVFV